MGNTLFEVQQLSIYCFDVENFIKLPRRLKCIFNNQNVFFQIKNINMTDVDEDLEKKIKEDRQKKSILQQVCLLIFLV